MILYRIYFIRQTLSLLRVRLKVMRECKACLAMACASKASLALQAYFLKPPDLVASLLIAPAYSHFT